MFTPSNTGLTSENTMVSHGITVQEKSWPVSEFCTNNIAMLLFIRYIAQHYIHTYTQCTQIPYSLSHTPVHMLLRSDTHASIQDTVSWGIAHVQQLICPHTELAAGMQGNLLLQSFIHITTIAKAVYKTSLIENPAYNEQNNKSQFIWNSGGLQWISDILKDFYCPRGFEITLPHLHTYMCPLHAYHMPIMWLACNYHVTIMC